MLNNKWDISCNIQISWRLYFSNEWNEIWYKSKNISQYQNKIKFPTAFYLMTCRSIVSCFYPISIFSDSLTVNICYLTYPVWSFLYWKYHHRLSLLYCLLKIWPLGRMQLDSIYMYISKTSLPNIWRREDTPPSPIK